MPTAVAIAAKGLPLYVPPPSTTRMVGVYWTIVRSVAPLLSALGSPVMGPTEAVLLMTVSSGVSLLTWTTRVKLAEDLAANKPVHAERVPPLPMGGMLELHPAAGVHDTRVVWSGRTSVTMTLLWSAELLLVTVSW